MVSGKKQDGIKDSRHEEEVRKFADTVAERAMDVYQSNNDADKTIRQMLQRLGKALKVSKIAVYELVEDEDALMLSYDWEAGDLFGVQATNFTYTRDDWEAWVYGLPEDALDVCGDRDAPEITRIQKKTCDGLLVKSYLASAFLRDSRPAGSVFAGDVSRKRDWMQAEKDALAAVTKTLNVFLLNMRQIQRMQRENRLNQTNERAGEADRLTGLPLYAPFREDADALMAQNENEWALLYIDFDRFSDINAKRGMDTGNRILKKYADFLRAQLKPGEIGCRYFSDVFLLLVRCTGISVLKEAVTKVYGETERWNAAYFPDMRLTMKTGIYQMTGEEDIEQAVKFAAEARASIKPGEKYAVFDESMRSRARKEARLERDMAKALKNDEFAIYMQPKVDLKTGATAGAEVLIRWDSESGQIMPDEFIELFEKNGFIKKLDVFMVERVLGMVRGWLDAGRRVVPVSMNISDDNMNDPAFIDKVTELVRKYSIPPRTIELELRENMFEENEMELQRSISSLRKYGIMFAIDDFGKGISSLNTIRNLPIDILKLDKDMFDHRHISEQERVMLTHMIRMAKSMDMKVLCGGVETQEQEEVLKTTECDMAQGYLYGKPMPAETFIKALNG